ncbi:MAG: helix-turn-helix domain-containing protein [Halobacteriales archaeon]|nr:helix-turn-helix domain-containing protein [Halobacteriales archaeon]
MSEQSSPIITEFRADHPLLREALAAVPGMRITWEREIPIDDERSRVLLWAEGDDFAAFEAAIEEDPTATAPERVVRFDDKRLYQLTIKNEGNETTLQPTLIEQGAVIQQLSATHQGWECRFTFPSREEFAAFQEVCARQDVDVTLDRIYVREAPSLPSGAGLTAAQREILLAALEAGYFEIPRDASLADVGEVVGISGNAASERLRRGMRTLVNQLQ